METAKALYSKLEGDRESYLNSAYDAAELTVPYLMPRTKGTHATLTTPYQSVGSRGVNNLASKLLLALLPPNAAFFRLSVDSLALAEEEPEIAEQIITDLETSLRRVEDTVMLEISRNTFRSSLHEALKQLIVTGNVLLYVTDDNRLRVFRLDRFVVERDSMGDAFRIIVKESLSPLALPPEAKQVIPEDADSHKEVDLYTHCWFEDDIWHVSQEIDGIPVPSSSGSYQKDKCPFIPLRMARIDGEDYGRGYVEEYMGDLQSLEGLSKAVLEASAAASKVLFLVNPNGTTRIKTIKEAANGAIVSGNNEDVTVLQTNKHHDLSIALQTMQSIKDRLGHAFLLTSGVVRDAERVTAEEIRMLSQELEAALGGLYSLLATEGQLPLVRRLLDSMAKSKRLPDLPKEIVEPVIITGVEALGRGHDLQKLDLFLQGAAQTIGPDQVALYVNSGDYLKRRATALGIKIEGLVRSNEEVAAMQEQSQQQSMIEKLGPSGIGGMTKIAAATAASGGQE